MINQLSIVPLVVAFAYVTLFALPASAQTVEVNQLELRGIKPGISAPGPKPVSIKDKAKINKRLDLRGALLNVRGDVKVKDNLRPTVDNAYNLGSSSHYWATLFVNDITLPEGGTVDGVDVSVLSSTVSNLSAQVEAQTELPECDNGEVLKVEAGQWRCGEDVDTDTNNTYTAGSNIEIVDGVISSTTEGAIYAAGDGLALSENTFSLQGTSYDNVVVVAKSGGDFDTIQAAIDSIDDASAYNRYLVWVAPGVYVEQVDLIDYVTVQGSERESVLIAYASESDIDAVVTMASNSILKDVSVQLASEGSNAVGVRVPSLTHSTIENVYVQLIDPPANTYGMYQEEISTVTIKNSEIYVGDAFTTGVAFYTEGTFNISNSIIQASNAGTAVGIQFVDLDDSDTNASNIYSSRIYAMGSGHSTDCATIQIDGTFLELYAYNSHFVASGCSVTTVANEGIAGEVNYFNSILNSSDELATITDGVARFSASGILGTVTGLVRCTLSYTLTGDVVDDTCAAI